MHYPGVYGDRNRLLAENGLKGFGGVLSFEVVPGVDLSIVLDNLHVFHLAVSLGAVESLAELPCRMTHFELPREERLRGITDELVRLSVGIEDVSDLIEDLGAGLRQGVRGAGHRRRKRSGARPADDGSGRIGSRTVPIMRCGPCGRRRSWR